MSVEKLMKNINSLDWQVQDEAIGDYFRLKMGINPIHTESIGGIIAQLIIENERLQPNYITLADIVEDDIESISGIYGILIDNYLVYIGRSKNIQIRWNQHKKGIEKSPEKKYELLREALQCGHTIHFVVLEYCDNSELKIKERENILKYECPPLNSELPTGRRAIGNYTLQTLFNSVNIIYHDLFGYIKREFDENIKTEQ